MGADWHICRVYREQDEDARLVKYGVRHYAHYRCYLDAGKTLADLQAWKVGCFPYRLLKERGLEAEASRLSVAAARKISDERCA